jgi:hypothetical protein
MTDEKVPMETTVNTDPHVKAYRFTAIHRVTAIFESCDPVRGALKSLQDSGFTEDEIEFFVGDAGAEQRDLSGEHHGAIVQALRDLETFVADETELHQQVDQARRRGCSVITVFTADDEEKKKRAAEILKACNASEVCFRGQWCNERL